MQWWEDEFIADVMSYRSDLQQRTRDPIVKSMLAQRAVETLVAFDDSVSIYDEPVPVSGEIINSTVLA